MNYSTLFFTLIVVFVFLLSLVTSQQYVLPDRYFINCGSNSDIQFTGKTFLKDENPTTFSVSGGSAAVNRNNNSNPEPPPDNIYQTARVFTENTGWYELEADDNNTFIVVRLYFSQFIYNGIELSGSKFEVSVLGFTLLSEFSVGNQRSVMREFIVPIGEDRKFKIEFVPSASSPSPAFVNAIEAFTAPKELFRHGVSPPQRVSPEGGNGDVGNITSSFAFNPIYRINVGGEPVEAGRDPLRRRWIPDAPFIFSNISATNKSHEGSLNYRDGSAADYDAPYDVYRTAKELTNKQLVNVTWRFKVNKTSMYLVRAHFCDIGGEYSAGLFNFFVYSRFKQLIPTENRWELYLPFYADFVVESGSSEVLNVSIGAIAGNNRTVFLNGLEIMELLSHSGAAPASPQTGKKKTKKVYIVVGCVVGGVALMLVLLLGFIVGSKWGKGKPAAVEPKPESNAMPSYGQSSYTSINIDFTINHPSPIPNLNLNLRFPFVDILQATNNFDESLMIGKGGFGKVYKGTLPNGLIVAVKRGEKGHGQGRPEFVTEIMVLSKIRHRHLVSLIGYCDERSEMILVYEYMEKGTLQDHLYDSDENLPKLSWERRLEICISASRGLHYLHTGSDGGIIHRDVKSTNILLNEKYVAKVADFGISRLVMDENDITDIKGSFGYLDPEYIRCMKLTQKSDVYSFGVVLLEVLCARPALDNTLGQNEANLADWAIRQINNGPAEAIMDPFLAGKVNPNSLRKFMETVERCLKDSGDERPNMIDVLWDLEYALKLQQMVAVDKEAYEDSTMMDTSLQLPASMIHRLPSNLNDDSEVYDQSALSYPSESQVFSQLNMDEPR